MKKAIGQTVRDLKREVNKKVLKVPGIEQKVLDATSNEPWGPHGNLLADIAHATKNYHEYQMIMTVIWKRINDTGKNWRHVYKALTVLEYLIAHGSEHVIDEIKEHSHQILTLSGFQYIDSNGRDQGNNVRRKSQGLVDLVNDKERVVEVRQKAAANRDKFRSTQAGEMYRPSSHGDRYDDERFEGHYGSRDEDRNGYGYGRDREYNYRDEDRYGRDSYSREGDQYGRDYEDRYGRDGYRDDDYHGRSRSFDDYGSRNMSTDKDKDHDHDDDSQSSSRGSGARADEQSQNGRGLERKFSEQNVGAPPSYEEAVGESQSHVHSERNGETPAASAPKSSSPPAPRVSSPLAPRVASPSAINDMNQVATPFGPSASPAGQEDEAFVEFDPRGPVSAVPVVAAAPTASPVPTTSNSAEMDLLGVLSDSFSANPLATMPVTSATNTSEADAQANFSGSTFAVTQPIPNSVNQPFEDPFGDSPFKALPALDNNLDSQQSTASEVSFHPTVSPNADMPPAAALKADTMNTFDFGGTFSGSLHSAPSTYPTSMNPQFLPQELSVSNQETDILAGILPPSGPSPVVAPQAGFSVPTAQPAHPDASFYGSFNAHAGSSMPVASGMGPQAPQFSNGTFLSQGGSAPPVPSNTLPQNPGGVPTHLHNENFLLQQGSAVPAVSQYVNHSATGLAPQLNSGNFLAQQGPATPVASQVAYQNPAGPASQLNNDVLGAFFSQGSTNPVETQGGPPSSTALALVPQSSKDKFETKSTVWADTLSRGLVNLNISGPKTNPLADIGIDFDAINRKEKRMEKQTTPAVTSTVTMGKAMGSGSGIGRAGASALRSQNPMMGSGMGLGMGMGMGGAPGSGMGMGGYGGMNQPMGMGMGMNMGMNAGMGMNMGIGQGGLMNPQAGFAPGSTMPGGYNPMMGSGGYNPQQPYGGGYR